MVQSVANAYLLVIAGSSRAQALRAQVETDQAVYDRTADQKRAGTTASIDVLRARVRAATTTAATDRAGQPGGKDKLALARVIGLPAGQQLRSRTRNPTRRWPGSIRIGLYVSLTSSADLLSAKASVRAAEDSTSAARAERYPNIGATGDYGEC